MLTSRFSWIFVLFFLVFLFVSTKSSFGACPVNMVAIGKLCIDKYEASVWSRRPDPVTGEPRGTRFGEFTDNYPCSDNGNNCHKSLPTKIFAASVPEVIPSRYITWFQAQQACANMGKRLPRNGEWQMAAAGTPDGDLAICNISTSQASLTGSRPLCVSHWGLFDMMGNVWEWVEDWMQPNSADVGSTSTDLYGNDTISGVNEAFPLLTDSLQRSAVGVVISPALGPVYSHSMRTSLPL